MFSAIIFDFDGVLALSDESQFKVIQATAKKYNIFINDREFPKLIGRTSINFLNSILTDKEKPFIEAIHTDYEKEFRTHITEYVKPINFSVSYIKKYKGPLIFALASMSSKKVITKLANHFGIYNKFKVIVTREEIQAHKPNPEIYLKTALKLNVKPDLCAVIEDSPIGAEATINAHMKCYVLLNGFNKADEFSKLPITGFIRSEKDFHNIK